MKTITTFLIACFLLAASERPTLLSYAINSRDSIDEVFYKRQLLRLKNNSPYGQLNDQDYKLWKEKMLIKGSWKWSFDEWQLLLDRYPVLPPEYYFNEELQVDNGGWALV